MARNKIPPKERYPGVPRGQQNGAGLTEDGAEMFDPEPLVLKVKGQVISDMDRIRAAVHNLKLSDASGEEHESFEESDDFEYDDDYGEFSSKHEILADQEELAYIVENTLKEAKRVERYRKRNPPKPVDVPVNGPPPAGNPAPDAGKP